MPEKTDPFAALQLSDFRALLIARLLVTLALQIQGIAVGWHIYALTKSALALGMIGLAEALPAIGVALYAGHVADVIDRKLIALACVSVLTAAVAGLTFATFSSHLAPVIIACIYALIALTGF